MVAVVNEMFDRSTDTQTYNVVHSSEFSLHQICPMPARTQTKN